MATIEELTSAVEERLTTYIETMRPGRPISVQDGVAMQLLLWNVIRLILQQEESNFVTLMTLLLNTIHVNKESDRGVFSMRYVNRFMDEMRITAPERRNFNRLMNLFVTTSDPRSRMVALRQVGLQSSLAGLSSDAERMRLEAFYTAV